MRWSGLNSWLEEFVRSHDGLAGAVHTRTNRDQLALVARFDAPTFDRDDGAEESERQHERIERGRGAAGLAFERNAAIFTRSALMPGAESIFKTRRASAS